MSMEKDIRRRLVEVVLDLASVNGRIVFLPHERLDADALGASISLAEVFRAVGCETTVLVDSELPESLSYLPLLETVQVYEPSLKYSPYDLALAIDCHEENRVGERADWLTRSRLRGSVDHHVVSTDLGRLDLVVPSASSTCELAFEIIWDLELYLAKPLFNRDIAVLLLAGIVTDTGRYSYSNTTPVVFRQAAFLLERFDVDLASLNYDIFERTTVERLQFKGDVYSGITAVGLAVGLIIGLTTDYFTNDERPPVRAVAKMSKSGPAFTILSGISYSFLSVLPAMVGIAVASLVAYLLCQPLGAGYAMYGIAMSAVGMLSIVGMIVSNDAYGPIVDNARGLVEMADLGEEALEITDELDSAGNTVKAITKGFAIGAAGLTVISMLGAYMTEVNGAAIEQGIIKAGETLLKGFDIIDPLVFFGLIVGAAVPAVFSAMLMRGVDRNAVRMVGEIHRQFDEIEGLKEGVEGVAPEYGKCIAIATDGALKELIPAGLFAIVATLIVGFVGGVSAIGGFLTGNIVSGLLLSLFMSNAGGLWDNAKKYVEAGNCGGKGSEAHKAAVVGDTVGDPFKDTAGPSINTQITVVSLLASLMASIFLAFSLFG
jgi:nanoRNase/pAp phosphatase (c-di-AMP/oligoRNAs hydrolase)